MKLIADRDALFAQLQVCVRVASSHSANQALSGVQIAATDGSVELRATDLDVGLRLVLDATVERDGVVVLPARLLADVVRTLPAGSVAIELRATEHDVEIVAGSATFHIRTLRVEDFPPLPEIDAATTTLPADAFVATVDIVARAASRDETRPVLTGILVTATGNRLSMVATDSYRLSVRRATLAGPIEGSFEANVPARALQELARLVQHVGADELAVGATTSQVVFKVGGAALSSRLIDGQFPNYEGLLPDAFEHELSIPAGELLDVVRRVSLLAQKNAPLRLAFSEGELAISAQTPDVGEAREALPVPFSGEPFEIGFNPDFLRDGLESIGEGNVVLKLISPLRPGLLGTGEGDDFLYLIMPIRLNV
jgi:DNA polymerase-3 subunit beta